jgi:hypothetical protein
MSKKIGWLYGIIPVEVEVKNSASDNLREIAGSIGLVIFIGFLLLMLLANGGL